MKKILENNKIKAIELKYIIESDNYNYLELIYNSEDNNKKINLNGDILLKDIDLLINSLLQWKNDFSNDN